MPSNCAAQVLIDPVCFLTCYPQLLYNFVYKVPLLSECLGSIEGLLGAARFLFSRDLIISEVPTLASPARPAILECLLRAMALRRCCGLVLQAVLKTDCYKPALDVPESRMIADRSETCSVTDVQ